MTDGEVFITARSKDIIIRAGRNICPQEAEEVVADVEGVRRGCVVAFGTSDPRQGTEKMVIVAEVRTENEKERESIRRSIQERIGCLFGSPADDVLLVRPRTVPKTSSGKLRRSACRDLYLKGALAKAKSGRLTLLVEMAFLEALLSARGLAARCGRAVYGGYAIALAAVTVLPIWLLALVVPWRRVLARAVRLGSRFYILMSGCRLQVRGLDHLREGEHAPYILVSNHASYLDPLPLLAVLPLDYAFAVKREAASWPVLGTFIRRLGHLPVERDHPRASAASAESLSDALRKGRSVFFFPEGTFTHATGLRPFKLGAFKLAVELGRSVVPLALKGTRRWLRDGNWLPRRSDLEIIIGAPIYPGSPSLSEVVRLRDEAARAIQEHVGEPRLDLVAAGVVRVGGEQ
jgi:1-acyl-sn-glycerol-3-phosphate acyltransferase